MKKKTTKKELKKQIVEIHIYVHQNNGIYVTPNGGGSGTTPINPCNPPYYVTC
ncbi:MAG: hypothetical protein ACR2IQ_02780 [Minisyncoccia bacterium]